MPTIRALKDHPLPNFTDLLVDARLPPIPPSASPQPPQVTAQRGVTAIKTCASCVHMTKGLDKVSYCKVSADTITGEAHTTCRIQRVAFTGDDAKAQKVATLLGLCGPNGDFWEVAPPVEKKRWWQALISPLTLWK